MKALFLVVGSFFGFHLLHAQSITDSLINQLNSEIERRPEYVQSKLHEIDSLKRSVKSTNVNNRYQNFARVYDAYKSFNYDSAFQYGRKLQRVARQMNDAIRIADSKIKIGFVLVSSGMFNEALDTMRSVKTSGLPDTLKTQYFYIMARTCYDLSDFNRDEYYRKIYTQRAHAYIDSALQILPENSNWYLLMSGLRDLHLRNMDAAQRSYEMLINKPGLSEQEFAIASSTLSFVYFYSGKQELAKQMLLRAAISDIRSSTKETLAMLNLADMLYKEGKIELAYKYVKVALEDADYYGARQRKTQVGAVFPIIEGKQLSMVESKRKTLLVYSLLITIFTLSAIGFSIIIYKQNKKLQKARRIISNANESLTHANHQLQDANKIKEEYIWYYFNTTAEYITKLDSLKKTLDLKLMTKKMEELRFAVDNINIKKEREDLYHNFDKVFLKLFRFLIPFLKKRIGSF